MNVLKGRWQLIVLLALFILPTLGAMVMVFSDWRPASFTNNGDLVDPPVQLSPDQWQSVNAQAPTLAGEWLIVMPQMGACQAACQQRLDTLGRILIALDRDVDRVRLVVLQPNSEPAAAIAPAEDVLQLTTDAAQVESLSAHEQTPMAAHIVDYRGYHVMRYAAPLNAPGLLDDLEKLLRLGKEEAERRALEEASSE